MGLKITTQIGTDQGITAEAYVRISSYSISKSNGQASFGLQLYQSQEASVLKTTTPTYHMPGQTARNNEIGENFNISMVRKVVSVRSVTKQVSREVDVEETITTTNEAGEDVQTTTTRKDWRMVDEVVEEEFTTEVIDFSPLDEVSIFTFAYEKLKEKLQASFGDENVISS